MSSLYKNFSKEYNVAYVKKIKVKGNNTTNR